jgi:hypothetical protein
MAVDAEVAGKGNATSRHEPDVEQADERDLDEGTASDLAGRHSTTPLSVPNTAVEASRRCS